MKPWRRPQRQQRLTLREENFGLRLTLISWEVLAIREFIF